jgi:hypothetical protein
VFPLVFCELPSFNPPSSPLNLRGEYLPAGRQGGGLQDGDATHTRDGRTFFALFNGEKR